MIKFCWKPEEDFDVKVPEWWFDKDFPKLSMDDLCQVWNGREDKSYKDYLEELDLNDKSRRKHFSLL